MKRLMVIGMVMASLVLIGGCCTLTAPDGTTTKSFPNCFKAVQDKVCNAPDSVLAVADIVINLLKPEAAILIPGSAPFIALVTAQSIKDTGCAALTGLNTMINFIEGYNTKAQLAMKTRKMKAAPAGTNVQPLISWRDRVK